MGNATEAPPHEEWIALSQETKRVEALRNEIMKFVKMNKESGNQLEGLAKLEETLKMYQLTKGQNVEEQKQAPTTSPGLHQSSTSLRLNSPLSLADLAHSQNDAKKSSLTPVHS